MINRILIVDDSDTARMFTRRCVEIAGLANVEFVEASNGDEALRVLQKSKVELVITDLNMPLMNGEELLKKIKQDSKTSGVSVLMITSTHNEAKRTEMIAMGALSVLSKPIAPATVMEALAPLLKAGGGKSA